MKSNVYFLLNERKKAGEGAEEEEREGQDSKVSHLTRLVSVINTFLLRESRFNSSVVLNSLLLFISYLKRQLVKQKSLIFEGPRDSSFVYKKQLDLRQREREREFLTVTLVQQFLAENSAFCQWSKLLTTKNNLFCSFNKIIVKS